jgi:cytochrome c oxidase subunit 1
MFILGYQGMPRRYFEPPPQYHGWSVVSTVGSWLLAVGLIIIFSNLIRALFKGPKASSNPWGGGTLEWSIPSPPPAENFIEIPVVESGPYGHGKRE